MQIQYLKSHSEYPNIYCPFTCRGNLTEIILLHSTDCLRLKWLFNIAILNTKIQQPWMSPYIYLLFVFILHERVGWSWKRMEERLMITKHPYKTPKTQNLMRFFRLARLILNITNRIRHIVRKRTKRTSEMCAQWRFWSDCLNADLIRSAFKQSDQNINWARLG